MIRCPLSCGCSQRSTLSTRLLAFPWGKQMYQMMKSAAMSECALLPEPYLFRVAKPGKWKPLRTRKAEVG